MAKEKNDKKVKNRKKDGKEKKVIEVKELIVERSGATIVKDVNFEIFEGNYVGMVGPNGGGKTTFLDALQLVLYGKFANCSNKGTLSYPEYLKRTINNQVDPKDGAALELQFRHTREGKEEI